MQRNRPVKKDKIKRSPNVRAQMRKAAERREDRLDKGEEKVEKLKGQIVSTKRTNNTFRAASIGVMATSVFAATNIFLNTESVYDVTLRHGLAFGAVALSFLFNRAFNNHDITLTEMLNRTNKWAKQDFTPEEVETFRELYKTVKDDFERDSSLKNDVKGNELYRATQGLILAVGITVFASVASKLNPELLENLLSRKEDTELTLDPNDPFLKTGKKLSFPGFDR